MQHSTMAVVFITNYPLNYTFYVTLAQVGYNTSKPIKGVVYCFYKITLKHVSVFYEFTGTVNHRFLTNQNARTVLSYSYFINYYIRKLMTTDYFSTAVVKIVA